jgi:hypothetical protein
VWRFHWLVAACAIELNSIRLSFFKRFTLLYLSSKR